MSTQSAITTLLILLATGLLAIGLATRQSSVTVATEPLPSAAEAEPVVSPSSPLASRPAPGYPLQRTLRYRYSISNPRTSTVRDARFWVTVPLAHTASQRLKSVAASLPFTEQIDAQGRQILRFELSALAPRATRDLVVTATVELANSPNPVVADPPDAYLAASPLVQSSDAAIIKLASRLRQRSPLETAYAIHRWVARNIAYTGYASHPKGALYALRTRGGDCTEFATLFAALARASDIPARVVGGYMASDDRLLRGRDYHNWAEFFVDGRWHGADPLNDVFQHPGQYVAMSIGVGKTRRFGASDERIDINMN